MTKVALVNNTGRPEVISPSAEVDLACG